MKYSTRQRELLLDYLKAHRDKQLSVDEILENLCGNLEISRSSVYRNIEKMLAAGTVQRFPSNNKRGFLYQYFDRNECEKHLHLKCVKCGNILHMEEDSAVQLVEKLQKESEFFIDIKRSIIIGSCQGCAAGAISNNEV